MSRVYSSAQVPERSKGLASSSNDESLASSNLALRIFFVDSRLNDAKSWMLLSVE